MDCLITELESGVKACAQFVTTKASVTFVLLCTLEEGFCLTVKCWFLNPQSLVVVETRWNLLRASWKIKSHRTDVCAKTHAGKESLFIIQELRHCLKLGQSFS